MRILLIAPQPFYQDRGTPIAVKLLANTLAEQGHDIHLLVFHEGEKIVLPNVNIHRNRPIPGISGIKPGFSVKKLICDTFIFFKSIALITCLDFDLVHAVEEAVFMAVIFNKVYKIPYVYDMDSCLSLQLSEKIPALQYFKKPMEWMEGIAVKGSKGVIAVCQSLVDIVKNVAPDKLVARIEDITFLETENNGNDILRERLGISATMVMYVGNLEKYQGIDLLLESFKIALETNEELHLIIIGGSSKSVVHYSRRAEQLNIQNKVSFCGEKPVDLLGYYLNQADILVSPRIQGNNTPMKIYSYLDSGKPVLATRLLTHTQVLNDTIAYLVEPFPPDMAKGLITLAHNPDLRKQLGENAKKQVRDEYSLAAFKTKVFSFYNEIKVPA